MTEPFYVMPEPIRVWAFKDAPENLRALSPHDGDEDWIAVLPADPGPGRAFPENPEWAQPGTPFGVCSVTRHLLKNGQVVLIGAHA